MLPKKKIKFMQMQAKQRRYRFLEEKGVDGYTFNPSLFRKNNAIDYIEYSKEIFEPCLPSLFRWKSSDTNDEMIKQAIVLHDLNPRLQKQSQANGISTLPVLEKLIDLNKDECYGYFYYQASKGYFKLNKGS